jgi:hypothetical protein
MPRRIIRYPQVRFQLELNGISLIRKYDNERKPFKIKNVPTRGG